MLIYRTHTVARCEFRFSFFRSTEINVESGAWHNHSMASKARPIAINLAAYKYTHIEYRFSDGINRKYSHSSTAFPTTATDQVKARTDNEAFEPNRIRTTKLSIECAFAIRNSRH